MKQLLTLALFLFVGLGYAQNLKSMSKNTNMSAKILNNDYIDKLASDQVEKLTKKLSLSESQQKQASGLVMDQLRSEKFQKMLSKYTPDQLMGSMGSDELSKALMKDEGFSNGLNKMLTTNQKSKLKSAAVKMD